MLDKKLRDLISTQVNKEIYSAYLYLLFADYFEAEGLDGFAHWYEEQAKEEMEHAMKFRRYLFDNGERETLEAIDKPNMSFNSFEEPLKEGLAHEKYVTSLINKIYDCAFDLRDYKTMEFLNWFVKEQVEEEKNAEDLLQKLKFVNGGHGIYVLNAELKNR
jgi:ferritin